MFQDSNLILGQYLEDVARKQEGYSSSNGVLNFRCPICKDSKKSRSKRRAYLYQRDGKWFFHCHNICGAMLGSYWLKTHFPDSYTQYISSVIQGAPEMTQVPFTRKTPEPPKSNYFVPINEGTGELFELAKGYCEKRKLLKSVWSKFLVADRGIYKDRLIIPFYRKGGSYEFFQGRALKGQEPKYLSKSGAKEFYNMDFLDKTVDYVVLEGPLDASFVRNSIALVGANLTQSTLKIFTGPCHFWLDNDETGKLKSKKLLEMGYSVFNWKKFTKATGFDGKDVNDLYVKLGKSGSLSYREMAEYFTSSLYDSLEFT